jgi:hypothetical protein
VDDTIAVVTFKTLGEQIANFNEQDDIKFNDLRLARNAVATPIP